MTKRLEDKVSIVVTTYLEKSKPYLDACIQSIKNQAYADIEVILVGKPSYAPTYDGVTTAYPSIDSFGCATGINFGISQSDPNSRYIFTINDDVILTKDCITNMVKTLGDAEMIINPISNCDNGFKYLFDFLFQKDGNQYLANARQYEYNDLKDYLPELMDASSLYPAGLILQNELCFYATMMPRKVWEKVGKFDEVFQTGQDDIDYSIRAKQNGVTIGICTNALAWHFSGASANVTMTDPVRIRNLQYFKHKWGYYPFHVELDLPPFDIRELDFIGE